MRGARSPSARSISMDRSLARILLDDNCPGDLLLAVRRVDRVDTARLRPGARRSSLRFARLTAEPSSASLPPLALIVAAHDEQAVIAAKVENALALDYPRELLELIVACDGCSDATAAQAREAGADTVPDFPRGGKIRAQDAAVRSARGEIVAFSDANALWEPDAARALVGAFTDPGSATPVARCALCRPPTANRHQPGGSVLALRGVVRSLESRAALDHRRQRRDLRHAARGLHRGRSDHGS